MELANLHYPVHQTMTQLEKSNVKLLFWIISHNSLTKAEDRWQNRSTDKLDRMLVIVTGLDCLNTFGAK